MMNGMLENGILPGLPADLIRTCYAAAPGNEIESGKFLSSESSAALAANTFGFFLREPKLFPPIPGTDDLGWPPVAITLEAEIRFPWAGGYHPWLDAIVTTSSALLGVESKRYEPYRRKSVSEWADAYWRPVWGTAMSGYCSIRDDLQSRSLSFERLDAAQLVKHAFGLRTAIHRQEQALRKSAVLVYLFAEPASWPNGRPILDADRALHRREIEVFAERVSGDEVRFLALSYRDLLASWRNSGDASVRSHAAKIEQVFSP